MKYFFSGRQYVLVLLIALLPLALPCALAQGTYNIIEKHHKVGLADANGNTLISPKYDKIGWSHGLNIPVNGVIGYYHHAWGLVSLKDRRVTAAKYYSLDAIQGSLIIATIKGKFSNLLFYGTINSKGETILTFKYRSIKSVHDLLIVSESKNDKRRYGLFTHNNKELLPTSYDHIEHFYADLFTFTDSLGQKGLIDKSGEIKISPTLDSISVPSKGYAKIFQSGRIGLIDSLGKIILHPLHKTIGSDYVGYPFDEYEVRSPDNELLDHINGDTIYIIDDYYIAVVRNGFTEVINQNHEVFYRSYQLESLENFNKYLIIRRNGKYDIIRSDGTPFEPYHFDQVKKDNYYLYAQLDDRWQIYNAYGSQLSHKKYEDIILGSTNLLPVKWNGNWGYLDHKGHVALPLKYDTVSAFHGKIAQVDYLGYKSLINQFGRIISKSSYDSIAINDDNTAVAISRSRTDILESDGFSVFQTYNKLEKHELGYLEKTEEGKVGLISRVGEIIFEPQLDSISPLIDDKYLILFKDGEIAVSHADGRSLIPFTKRYEEIRNISEESISVKINGSLGFINLNEQLIIANRYDDAQCFHENRCAIKINGGWGFIDTKERLIVQPNLDSVTPYQSGISIVQRDNKYGVLHLDGTILVSISYDQIIRTKNNLLIVKKENKYGVYNLEGKRILDFSYDAITETSNQNLIIKRRGLYGVINNKGLYEIPLKYLHITERPDGNFICQKKG